MKKLLAIAMAVLMLLALAVPTYAVSAEEVSSLVVFGDSISTGYGLSGTLYTRASYANLTASALGVSEGQGYVNYAVDGYTSADILAAAKAHTEDVADADLIMMTCGGNDVLSKMLVIAMQAAGVTSLDLAQAAAALAAMDVGQVSARLYSDTNNAVIETALEGYRANLTELVEFLTATNPDARILFLTQYNPLSGVSNFAVLDAYTEDVIGRLNAVMTEVVSAGGCEFVDTYSVMVGQGALLSNILLADIHPNALGHAMMAQKVKLYLGITATATETTEATVTSTLDIPPVTTVPEMTTSTAVTATTAAREPETEQATTVTSTGTASASITPPSETAEDTRPTEDVGVDTGINPTTPSAIPTTVIMGISLLALGVTLVIIAALIRRKR